MKYVSSSTDITSLIRLQQICLAGGVVCRLTHLYDWMETWRYLALAIMPFIAYTGFMEKNIATTSHTASSPILVYAGIWFAVIAWGTSFVAARALLHAEGATQTSLSPTVLAALRFSIASLFFLFPLAKAILRRQISLRNLLLMACLGQIAFSLYFWLQYTGVQNTNASISSILVVGLIPVITAFLSH